MEEKILDKNTKQAILKILIIFIYGIIIIGVVIYFNMKGLKIKEERQNVLNNIEQIEYYIYHNKIVNKPLKVSYYDKEYNIKIIENGLIVQDIKNDLKENSLCNLNYEKFYYTQNNVTYERIAMYKTKCEDNNLVFTFSSTIFR